MITDPDEPGYRFPQPGERYWHGPWECWVVIVGDTPYGHVEDEVAARRESDGQLLVVKLRSLDDPGPEQWGVRRLGEVEPRVDEAAARELADRWSYGHPGIELVKRASPEGPWEWVARPGQPAPPSGDESWPDGPAG